MGRTKECDYAKRAFWLLLEGTRSLDIKNCTNTNHLQVAQVFATKQDLLPAQYLHKLSFVFENCEPMPLQEILKTIDSELSHEARKMFEHIEETPLACATIAQVHRGVLLDTPGAVAIKFKRSDSERLMTLDMANMLLVSRIMDKLNLHLPFDHTSVLLEYQSQVSCLE